MRIAKQLLALALATGVGGAALAQAPEVPEVPKVPAPAPIVEQVEKAGADSVEVDRVEFSESLREHILEAQKIAREAEQAAREAEAEAHSAHAEARKEVEKQVRILRENGNVRIIAIDENGEKSDVAIEMGEEFGGTIASRIFERLEEKGVLDKKGWVVEGAMDKAPHNVRIGIDTEELKRGGDDNGGEAIFGLLIGLVVVLGIFGTPVLIVWLATRNSYRKKQLVIENINRMVAEGRDIPPELLDAMESEAPQKSGDRGFNLMAVGLAIFIWFSWMAGPELGSVGLIPLFIGVARFISWKMDQQPNQNGGQVG
ncbi:DUF6249 domain-containing protein [Biformimicrobium ophioploci]|uniref:DUF6249 domain-containing protein n=1 Tax=Biformimicrobium ophioploci TaxID=3036711 RepID=A0ABQ6M2B5_9GAMM|nr:DUF6249 domain-containing protein [Microbulbifer sp. NKW57]GMG88499.1 hypothetical protein MNKW57_28200 [Microbulbifer sp. NKW57]